MLLALTIISTVAGMICALSCLGLLPQRRRQPRYVVILVSQSEAVTAERQAGRVTEDLLCEIELPEAS